jgi:Protein of unknown function (DUF3592)
MEFEYVGQYSAMTTKLWEHLRGYDKWIETTATFESADLEKTPHTDRGGNVTYTWASFDTIVWTDQTGTTHRADFRVPDDSPIYQLVDGNTATIRYNPANPDRFYYPDLLRARIATTLRRAGLIFLGLAFLLVLMELSAWLNLKSPR